MQAVITDKEVVLPLIQENIAANGLTDEARCQGSGSAQVGGSMSAAWMHKVACCLLMQAACLNVFTTAAQQHLQPSPTCGAGRHTVGCTAKQHYSGRVWVQPDHSEEPLGLQLSPALHCM
jgi:hypothetical protein